MGRFAVVKRLDNGSSMWVCTTDDLSEATKTIRTLTHTTGLEHFIHDFEVGGVVARSKPVSKSVKRD